MLLFIAGMFVGANLGCLAFALCKGVPPNERSIDLAEDNLHKVWRATFP
jgi:hypothetical protein